MTRRWLALILGVAALSAAGAVAARRLAEPDVFEASEDPAEWAAYSSPWGGWSLRHPPEWEVQPFDQAVGGIALAGILVSNTNFRFRHPHGGTTLWDMRGLPPEAVVLEFGRQDDLGLCVLSGRDTRFPLSLEEAEEVFDPGTGIEEFGYGAPEPRRHLPVSVDGDTSYRLNVWFGPEASEADREAAARVVGTITRPTGLTC
jgi:hypothetical protein